MLLRLEIACLGLSKLEVLLRDYNRKDTVEKSLNTACFCCRLTINSAFISFTYLCIFANFLQVQKQKNRRYGGFFSLYRLTCQ